MKEDAKQPNQYEITDSLRREAESIALLMGGDYNMTVGLGPWGSGWHWDFVKNHVNMDPKDLATQPIEVVKGVAAHEGNHKLASRTESIMDIWQEPGFSFGFNAVEDPRANEAGMHFNPGTKKWIQAYIEKDLKPGGGLNYQEIPEEIQKQIGYIPDHMKWGAEMIRYWHEKEFRNTANSNESKKAFLEQIPDKSVKEAVEKTMDSFEEYYKTIPQTKDEMDVKWEAQRAAQNFRDNIWPTYEKLVEKSYEDHSVVKMIEDMMKQKDQQNKQREDDGQQSGQQGSDQEQQQSEGQQSQQSGESQQSGQQSQQSGEGQQSGQQGSGQQQQSGEGQQSQQSGENQQGGEGQGNQQSQQNKQGQKDQQGNSEGGEGQKSEEESQQGEGQGKGQGESSENNIPKDVQDEIEDKSSNNSSSDSENQKDSEKPNQPSSRKIPWDKLSDKAKEAVKKAFESLPEEKKEEYRKQAKKDLENEEDKANEKMRGKMNDPRYTKTHKEQADEESKREQSQDEDGQNSRIIKNMEEQMEKAMRHMSENPYFEYLSLPEVDKAKRTLIREFKRVFEPTEDPDIRYTSTGTSPSMRKAMQSEADPRKINIFESKGVPMEKRYRFIFLVDLSGSMSGTKIEETFKALIPIIEALNYFGLESEIQGYADNIRGTIHVYKSFETKKLDRKTRDSMGELMSDGGGGTPTKEAMKKSLARLHERMKKVNIERTYFIPLTDGSPTDCTERELLEFVKKIRKDRSIITIGFGIGPDSEYVSRSFPELPREVKAAVAKKTGRNPDDVDNTFDSFSYFNAAFAIIIGYMIKRPDIFK